MKTDIRHYTTQELSLQVYNTWELYRMRFHPDFKVIVDATFAYTPAQWDELEQDIAHERFERTAN